MGEAVNVPGRGGVGRGELTSAVTGSEHKLTSAVLTSLSLSLNITHVQHMRDHGGE